MGGRREALYDSLAVSELLFRAGECGAMCSPCTALTAIRDLAIRGATHEAADLRLTRSRTLRRVTAQDARDGLSLLSVRLFQGARRGCCVSACLAAHPGAPISFDAVADV